MWKIITVYNGESMKVMRKILEEKIGELEEEVFFIRGDFNARIGLERQKYEGAEEYEITRRSKDKVNNKGKELIGLLEDRGWKVENDNNQGDKEGEWILKEENRFIAREAVT